MASCVWLCFRKAKVGIGWAISPLLCTDGLSKQSSGLRSGNEVFFLVGGHWTRTVTIVKGVHLVTNLHRMAVG